MTVHDPYVAIDDVLKPWAQSHGINVWTRHRDDIVRTFWVHDRQGNQRAQLWLGIPNACNDVTVYVAEFRPDLAAKWGVKLQRTVALADLAATLDEFSAAAQKWAGDGAFT
jgi:hypothetical protein